jgi:hypothetical protein
MVAADGELFDRRRIDLTQHLPTHRAALAATGPRK